MRPQPGGDAGVDLGLAVGAASAAGGDEAERNELHSAIRRMEAAREAEAPGPGGPQPQGEGGGGDSGARGESARGARGSSSEAASKGGKGVEGSTVHVGNVPAELNDLGALHAHFKQFGRIVNVQIKAEQR